MHSGFLRRTLSEMTNVKAIRIFDYFDYRLFLHDWYTHHRKVARVTLRAFSKRAGFASPNFLKLVMEGDRNLTTKSLKKFMIALEFNKQEQEFFSNLVFFNQAVTHDEKDFYYQALLKSRKFNELTPIVKEQYRYYSEWYHPVVREMLVSKSFDGDIEKLAGKLIPAVTVPQVKKSIELLTSLGFVKKNVDGQWLQSLPLVTTGPESQEQALTQYHQKIFDLGKQALEEINPEDRDVSALTLGIRHDLIPEIKKRIQVFRREILELVADQTSPEQVVLLTMQLLPVTTTGGAL